MGEVLLEDLYEERDEIRETFEEAKRTGFASCETTLKNGKRAILNFTPVRDENGNIINVIGTAQDIVGLKELRNSKVQMETIMENAPVLISVHDRENRWLMANTMWEKVTGFKAEEFKGKITEDIPFVTSETLKVLRMDREKLSEGEEVERFDLPYRSKGGRKIIVSAMETPLKDSEGNVTGSVFAAQDVTELRRREEELERERERSSALIESIPDFQLMIDMNGLSSELNTGVCDLTGYSREELLKKRIEEAPFFTEEGLKVFKKLLDRLKGEEETYAVDMDFVKKDGTHRIGSLALTNVVAGGRTEGHMITIRDITELKEREGELKRISAMVKNSGTPMILSDPTSR
ncbi:MAG: sensory histidine kinase AtoS [Candidatus Methanolliviera sp. GoM_oil]|nr:MAG: sensory histidine kinase AtoS [Candidatus Methanolliviera sp. GoM_oil]